MWNLYIYCCIYLFKALVNTIINSIPFLLTLSIAFDLAMSSTCLSNFSNLWFGYFVIICVVRTLLYQSLKYRHNNITLVLAQSQIHILIHSLISFLSPSLSRMHTATAHIHATHRTVTESFLIYTNNARSEISIICAKISILNVLDAEILFDFLSIFLPSHIIVVVVVSLKNTFRLVWLSGTRFFLHLKTNMHAYIV